MLLFGIMELLPFIMSGKELKVKDYRIIQSKILMKRDFFAIMNKML